LPLAGKLCLQKKNNHTSKRVVITGGPGAGKTALLEIARKKIFVSMFRFFRKRHLLFLAVAFGDMILLRQKKLHKEPFFMFKDN